MGELEVAQANAAAGREYYARALAAFETVQAGPDLARTQALMQSVGDKLNR